VTADLFAYVVLPALVIAGLLAHSAVQRRRRLAVARRRALAAHRRNTPWSELVGLTDEECAIVPRDQIDQFMKPEDMSRVAEELEQLEKDGEFDDLATATAARLRRQRPAPRAIVAAARPAADEQIDDDERYVLARTDARHSPR
jgi:hypothetical protein